MGFRRFEKVSGQHRVLTSDGLAARCHMTPHVNIAIQDPVLALTWEYVQLIRYRVNKVVRWDTVCHLTTHPNPMGDGSTINDYGSITFTNPPLSSSTYCNDAKQRTPKAQVFSSIRCSMRHPITTSPSFSHICHRQSLQSRGRFGLSYESLYSLPSEWCGDNGDQCLFFTGFVSGFVGVSISQIFSHLSGTWGFLWSLLLNIGITCGPTSVILRAGGPLCILS